MKSLTDSPFSCFHKWNHACSKNHTEACHAIFLQLFFNSIELFQLSSYEESGKDNVLHCRSHCIEQVINLLINCDCWSKPETSWNLWKSLTLKGRPSGAGNEILQGVVFGKKAWSYVAISVVLPDYWFPPTFSLLPLWEVRWCGPLRKQTGVAVGLALSCMSLTFPSSLSIAVDSS